MTKHIKRNKEAGRVAHGAYMKSKNKRKGNMSDSRLDRNHAPHHDAIFAFGSVFIRIHVYASRKSSMTNLLPLVSRLIMTIEGLE